MEVSGLSSLPIASEMKRRRSDTRNGVGVSTLSIAAAGPPAIRACPPADHSSQQFNHLPQRLGADLATTAHPCTTAKRTLDNPLAIRPPRPSLIRHDRVRNQSAASDRPSPQWLRPPSEPFVA